MFDQRGIVRGYMKYDNEIRIGANVKQIVHRAMQIAHSEPTGPVYLVAAREVIEADIPQIISIAAVAADRADGLPPSSRQIAQALASAKRPLIVTSYLGRSAKAVGSW